MDTVEDGRESMRAEEPLVVYENIDCLPAHRAEIKRVQSEIIEGRDILGAPQTLHDFAEITGQGALPAEGVDAIVESRRDKFIETLDYFDSSIIGGRREWRR